MNRRTLLPTGISIVLGGIILLSSIIGMIVNKNVEYYSIFLLILSSLVIISAGSLTYYLHDRLFGFVNLVGTIMGFVAVRMFYGQNFNDYSIPFILILLCVLSLIFNFSSIILSVLYIFNGNCKKNCICMKGAFVNIFPERQISDITLSFGNS